MNNRYKIAILDDEAGNRQEWKKELESLPKFSERFEIELIEAEDGSGPRFIEIMEGLTKRREAARNSEELQEKNYFDDVHLLIVDYDLLKAKDSHESSGEEIAYLVRCYSRCKAIMTVNQFGPNPFDLELTNYFPDSFADVNVGAKQVAHPGLWQADWPAGFRPWYWPLLPKLIEDMTKRVTDAQVNLDQPVKQFLGFDKHEESWRLLSRESLVWLSPKKTPDEITIRDFVRESRLGLRHKDKPWCDESVAYIAAARLGQWLDYAVLVAQDVLVDAPHLIERYPSLGFKDKAEGELNPEDFDRFARIADSKTLGLENRLQQFAFEKAHWLSRPSWYWPEVTLANWIEEVRNPWGTPIHDAFFCEDVSCFARIEDTREFRIRIPSSYETRRCIRQDSKKAAPWKEELPSVDYQPIVRLMD